MSQFNAPQVRRSSGELNVYTGLLLAALVVLLAGCILMVLRNLDHSASGNQSGGVMTLVE